MLIRCTAKPPKPQPVATRGCASCGGHRDTDVQQITLQPWEMPSAAAEYPVPEARGPVNRIDFTDGGGHVAEFFIGKTRGYYNRVVGGTRRR